MSNSNIQAILTVEEAFVLPCEVCGESSKDFCQCNEAHLVCKNCLEKEVRDVMTSDKVKWI